MTIFRRLFQVMPAIVLACCASLIAQPPAATVPSGATPDAPPQVNVPQRAPINPVLPTIFVVGDSTASNGPNLGWGSHLANYFDLTKVNVANRAIAGRSSRSYMDEGHWDSTLAEIKAGDFVLLQWGQNDGSDLGGAGSRNARGDLRGDGDATQDVMQAVGPKAGQVETIHTYGWYNRKYVADILAKGATPMFLSMTIHNSWKPDANGTLHVSLDMRFGPVMWKIAQENHLAFIDMAAGGSYPDGIRRQGQSIAVVPDRLRSYQPGRRRAERPVGGNCTGDREESAGEIPEGTTSDPAGCRHRDEDVRRIVGRERSCRVGNAASPTTCSAAASSVRRSRGARILNE